MASMRGVGRARVGAHSGGHSGTEWASGTCCYLLGLAVHWFNLLALRRCSGSPVGAG